MAKGRKKIGTDIETVGPDFVGATPADMAAQEAWLNRMQEGMEDAAALGEAMGGFRTATFYETISHSVMLASYEKAKKSKAWRFLKNKEAKYFASLEEFCDEVFPLGLRRLQQIAGNRNLLGQETFEQAERLGLRQVDYNTIKSLPVPQQEIIAQAIAEGTSRDHVIQALHELAALDKRENDALAAENAELVARNSCLERLNVDKGKQLDELTMKHDSALALNWPDIVTRRKEEGHTLGMACDEVFTGYMKLVDKTSEEVMPLDEGSDALNGYKTVVRQLGEQIERICTLAASLRAKFDDDLGGLVAIEKTYTLEE